jgi:membrane-associated phospholipid phosphatase
MDVVIKSASDLLNKVWDFLLNKTAEEWVFFIIIPVTTACTLLFVDYDPGQLAFLGVTEQVYVPGILLVAANLYYPLYSFVVNVMESSNSESLMATVRREISSINAKRFKNGSFTVMGVLSCGLALGLLMSILYHNPQPIEVYQASNVLLDLDRWILGINSPFWFSNMISASLMDFLVFVYLSLTPIFSILFFVTLFGNTKAFRRLVLASIVAFCVSIPFWVLIPAVSPDEMFYQNILKYNSIPEYSIHVSANSPLNAYLDKTNGMWSNASRNFFAVTTFPSMHVAWAFIVSAVAFKWKRWSAVILGPWLFLVIISTVTTLQHYVVDAFLGLVVGFLSLGIIELIDTLSQAHTRKHYHLLTQTQNAFKKFWCFLKNAYQ